MNKRKLGIIGVGPRGSYALEKLVVELESSDYLSTIHFDLFEESGNFGNGQIYTFKQAVTNWININERLLKLERRKPLQIGEIKIDAFPSYHEWIGKDLDQLSDAIVDTFPPRKQLGKYLSERCKSLIHPLVEAGLATLYREKVVEIKYHDTKKIDLITEDHHYTNYDEILITIGHQPTEDSAQIKEWRKWAESNDKINLFSTPYPLSNYLSDEYLSYSRTIGIRGFGLSTIDIVRGIAEEFGDFVITDNHTKACKYQAFEGTSHQFVPFSLDGLPPVPKPLNARIDSYYAPTDIQLEEFTKIIGDKNSQKNAKSPQFLINALAPIAAEIFINLPNTKGESKPSYPEVVELIEKWLTERETSHSVFISSSTSTIETMQKYVDMAIGKGDVSLDYCITQVWRILQPTIYEQLSYNECSDEVTLEIIQLDESTKRYTYGPPVESIQQLIALYNAELINFEFLSDPSIELTNNGWKLFKDEKEIVVDMMINSVLDAPKIKEVTSSIIVNLLSDHLINVVHDDLGVTTTENAYLVTQEDEIIPIALLGRLAKGTVIGVDAILECFGDRPEQWAKKVSDNHRKAISNV